MLSIHGASQMPRASFASQREVAEGLRAREFTVERHFFLEVRPVPPAVQKKLETPQDVPRRVS